MSALTVVGLVAGVLTAATPAPGSQDVNPTNGGSPGFVGFVFTFVLAIVVIGLMVSFVRGMRRMEHNSGRQAGGTGQSGVTPDDGAGDDRATGLDASGDRLPGAPDGVDAGVHPIRPVAPPAG